MSATSSDWPGSRGRVVGMGHGSGPGGKRELQQVQWRRGGTGLVLSQMQVTHGRADGAVPEPALDDGQLHAGLEQPAGMAMSAGYESRRPCRCRPCLWRPGRCVWAFAGSSGGRGVEWGTASAGAAHGASTRATAPAAEAKAGRSGPCLPLPWSTRRHIRAESISETCSRPSSLARSPAA